jgi:hypothetical protein
LEGVFVDGFSLEIFFLFIDVKSLGKNIYIFIDVFNLAKMFIDVFSCCWGVVLIDVFSLEKYLYIFIDVFTFGQNIYQCV